MQYATLGVTAVGTVAAVAVTAATLAGVHIYWIVTITGFLCVTAVVQTLALVQRRIERSRSVVMTIVGEALYKKAEAVVAQRAVQRRRRR